jgi:alkylation response protein AidB-like acyl-CoA dehydrogenase
MARVCIADAYSHAITRTTFGKHLIDHQAIRNKFTTLGTRILPAHAFMESVVAIADSKTNGINASSPRYGGLVALLKVTAARALEEAVRESQQVMGGLGYSRSGKGSRIEQISRDVRVMVVGGGSEEILNELAFVQERLDLNSIHQDGKGMSSKL